MLFNNEYKPPDKPADLPTIRQSDESDSAFLAALQALEPLLHEDEKLKYASELGSKLSISQRFAAWRARRKW